MTPDDTRKDPGAAKTQEKAKAFREAAGNQAELVATQADVIRAAQANPYAGLQGPGWPNLGMTTQVLPGVAGAQSFNAQALTQTVPDLYMSTHRQ